jgi:hypothetical protein
MTDADVMTAYMSTHVLINSKTPLSEWTQDQIVCAFAMLPAPAVSLEEFRAKLNLGATVDEMTEEEIAEHNTKTLRLHKGKEAV